MKSLYFQYDNTITNDRFVWVAEIHITTGLPIVAEMLNLLDSYEFDTLTGVERNRLDTLEAEIARYGFYFADSIEDLPTIRTRYEPVDEGDACD